MGTVMAKCLFGMRQFVVLTFALPLCSLLAANEPAMKPFVMNHRDGAGSVVDLSFLLDPPAGKDGFIRVEGSHLVRPDGRPIRFWGVNLTDWSRGSVMMPPREDAPMWAATLARFGVNCVRLHFLDLDSPRGLIDAGQGSSREFDTAQLDRLDFFLSELKKRGVYIDLNLNVGRSYKTGDGVVDFDKIRWAKGLTMFDPRLIELQKEYARKILTRVNPYTSLEYRNDPAIAIIEMVNENALYLGFRAPTPYYDDELTRLYNAWLAENLMPGQLTRLRQLTGVIADQQIPRLQGGEVAAAPKERFYAEMRFYMEMESRYFGEMKRFLKEDLGVRSALIGTADHAHAGSSYPLLASTSLLDIVDGHTYWQHPGSDGIPDTPMVSDPLNSTVVELSRSAFAGRPYTVTEVNHPYPNEWSCEGIPILAAYSAFQDWDGVFWYTFEPKRAADWRPYIGDPFDISHDPVRLTQFAAGALLYLRGDISVAREIVMRSYSREQVYDSVRLPGAERPYFTPGFPPATPLRHGVRIESLDGRPTGPFDPFDTTTIVSDTGELVWTLSPEKQGLVTVETQRTQAVIGFIGDLKAPLKNLSPRVNNPFCSVVLSSLDSRPIPQAARMLLVAGARAANTGQKWNDSHSALAEWGGSPTLIEPVSGAVVLRSLEGATAVTARALDGAGRPIGPPIVAERGKIGWIVNIGSPATTWYEVTVERAAAAPGR